MIQLRLCYKKRSTLLLVLLLISVNSFSQSTHDYGFVKYVGVPVVHNKDSFLLYPWSGGMNNIQMASIDIDLDGIKDIVAFDVHGRRILPFINKADKEGEINYVYDPSYVHLFPEDINGFLQLIDFDGDGKEDIFTYENAGLKVYKNVSDTVLQFELFTEQITSKYYNSYINLFCTEGDYIVIKDIDGDGDVDVLAFWALGKYIDYHKNQSVEKYGHRDSLDFHLSERC
ncbi:MAG TPA: VCBS repeat-containing protein, partial [Bacteroidales bacterium]|nr:VCBS repeat-containing protein [Bacteroidales bacterium]